jgi:polysaccharide export outer membrane protein
MGARAQLACAFNCEGAVQIVFKLNVSRCMKAGLGLVAISAVAACTSTPEPLIGPVSAGIDASLGQTGYESALAPAYILRGGDTLQIAVFREPDLSTAGIVIGPNGTIGLPLIGQVDAGGLTSGKLAENISRALDQAGLRNPDVSVNVTEFGSHLVTVEGGVEEPGVYQFAPGAKLSGAVALAKGPNRVAKLREVVVFREVDAQVMIAKFDYQAVRQGTMIDPVLQPGDRVVVGISGLSQAWQDAIQAIPVFALFTRI